MALELEAKPNINPDFNPVTDTCSPVPATFPFKVVNPNDPNQWSNNSGVKSCLQYESAEAQAAVLNMGHYDMVELSNILDGENTSKVTEEHTIRVMYLSLKRAVLLEAK